MKLVPYLKMKGNARKALKTYAKIFNGWTEKVSEYKDSPYRTSDNQKYIIHGEVHFKNNCFFLADIIAEMNQETKNSVQPYELCLNFQAEEYNQALRIYRELKKIGQTLMEFEKTFWGAYYGKVKDQFGVTWSLNCDLSPKEKQKQAKQKKQAQKKTVAEKAENVD